MADEPSKDWMRAERKPMLDLRLDQPHSARVYDYYQGGKTNYAADREAAGQVAAFWPSVFSAARENRAFMHRATRVLAEEHGIHQWLDIGTGIPTSPNLHEVAQGVVPDARVVYVDHDPIVLAHARALLTSTAEGATSYVQADVREPEKILADDELRQTLDLSKPVALSLNALMHFVIDAEDPYGIVGRMLEALPSGSALALSHCTPDFDPPTWDGIGEFLTASGTPVQFRTKAEVARFFEGLDLIEPGLAVCHRWRPAGTALRDVGCEPDDESVSIWAGVGIKP